METHIDKLQLRKSCVLNNNNNKKNLISLLFCILPSKRCEPVSVKGQSNDASEACPHPPCLQPNPPRPQLCSGMSTSVLTVVWPSLGAKWPSQAHSCWSESFILAILSAKGIVKGLKGN